MRDTFLPRTVRAEADALAADGSRFCGPAALVEGEPWPACGKCGGAMQLFVQLNSRDLPPEAGRPFGDGILQLFYCTSRDCEGGWEPFDPTHLCRVLRPGLGVRLARRPAEGTFDPRPIIGWLSQPDLPNYEEIMDLGVSLSDEQMEALYEAEHTSYPVQGEKLLGWPFWVQGVEYVACPECGQQMKYIFQVDSEANIPFALGDGGVGHISMCERHPEKIAFTWACY